MKSKRIEAITLVTVLLLQSIFFVGCGFFKAYIHMDEAYSFGLAGFDSVELQDTEGFYNQWHDGEYYEDYLAVQDKDFYKYGQVYENQKNDVHPPLYYLILRLFMGFTANRVSFWCGLIPNVIIYVFITLFMYLLLQRLFEDAVYKKEASLFLAVLSSLTLASLSSVLMIRMYALSTLNILVALYLHFRLNEAEQPKAKQYVFIALNALIGSLTHYHYLFFLFALYVLFAVKYIKGKKTKAFVHHTLSLAAAAGVSLMIFPHSLTHLFSGYRGQGSIDELKSFKLDKLFLYLDKLDKFAFNGLLILFAAIILVLTIYAVIRKKDCDLKQNGFGLMMLLIPSLFYFLLVAFSSPYIELRYILPVSATFFVGVVFVLYRLISALLPCPKPSVTAVLLALLMVIMPIVQKTEVEPFYRNRAEVVQTVKQTSEIPALYMIDSENIRFLDDILLFSMLEQSYITLDTTPDEAFLQDVFEGIDTSNGVYIFVSGKYSGEGAEWILELVADSLDMQSYTQVTKLNAARLYLFTP